MAFRIRPVNGNTMGHETSDNENVDNMDPYLGMWTTFWVDYAMLPQ
ncbi:hypothetical protein [Yaniella flava]